MMSEQKPVLPRAAAFLFDMDGTIVDNMAFHTQSWQIMLAKRGVEVDADAFFRDTAGRQSQEILRTYLRDDLSDKECKQFSQEKDLLYREIYAPHRKLADGFLPLLLGARELGIRLAVGTAAPDENVRFILDDLDVRKHFDIVVGARDVSRGKPHPDVFLRAAEGCGVDPAECLVFEDAPLGVEAAARAGMSAVVLTTTLGEEAFSRFDNIICMCKDYRDLSMLGVAGL
jgi:beta-phosphoglucomutase family hydrolase